MCFIYFILYCLLYYSLEGWRVVHDFQGSAVVKIPPDNSGGTRDVGSITELERSLEEEMATHSSIRAWRIPWTEELVGYGP